MCRDDVISEPPCSCVRACMHFGDAVLVYIAMLRQYTDHINFLCSSRAVY